MSLTLAAASLVSAGGVLNSSTVDLFANSTADNDSNISSSFSSSCQTESPPSSEAVANYYLAHFYMELVAGVAVGTVGFVANLIAIPILCRWEISECLMV